MFKTALVLSLLVVTSTSALAQAEHADFERSATKDWKPTQKYWLSASLNTMAAWAKMGPFARRNER